MTYRDYIIKYGLEDCQEFTDEDMRAFYAQRMADEIDQLVDSYDYVKIGGTI